MGLNKFGRHGFFVVALLSMSLSCSIADDGRLVLTHVQGEMAGEVTESSVILQSRLTTGSYTFVSPKEHLWASDIPGSPGIACFEVSMDSEFGDSFRTEWIEATAENDFIVKTRVSGLKLGTRYYYRVVFGRDRQNTQTGPRCTFKTHDGKNVAGKVRFVVVTGMNFEPYRHYYDGEDKALGYIVLETILGMQPDFFVATGDNVYYDAPSMKNDTPEHLRKPAATTLEELRKKWHEQLAQPRFVKLFAQVPTYWEKDDHDFRYNDCDTTGDLRPSPELGKRVFLEQVPVVSPDDPDPLTYRTYRVNKHLQIWFTEGRDYRSPNMMAKGPEKTMWGATQKAWLKRTLLESDAAFKLLISPTPLIGPDDIKKKGPSGAEDDDYKRDNQAGPYGYSHERDEFFRWLLEHGLHEKGFYIVCGDRHWQYHSISSEGIEEFSCGAILDENSRIGRPPGDPESNDPEGRIKQPYTQKEKSGGFLRISVDPDDEGRRATLDFAWYDEHGTELHSTTKTSF